MAWIAWNKLSFSKESGGLGFREIATFNDSLLAKIGWKLLQQPDCLLSQVLLGKYCHSSSFMESTIPRNASHGWRGIMESREVLRKGLGWMVGDGESISIWNSPWMSAMVPLQPMGPPTEEAQFLKVKDLLLPDSTSWNLEIIRKLVPQYEDDIRKLILGKSPRPDKLRWLPVKTGKYTTKSGYSLSKRAAEELQPDAFNWNSAVWKITTSPKLKMFLWKVARNALPLGTALATRGLDAAVVCKRCGAEESAMHLFYHCPFAKRVWELAPVTKKPSCSDCAPVKELLSKAGGMITLPPVGLVFPPLFPWLLWFLWKARNLLIFEEKVWTEEDTLRKAITEARNWQAAKSLQPIKLPVPINRNSGEVHHEAFRCYSDAAWLAAGNLGGMGWVIKDPSNVPILQGSTSRPFVSSVIMAEALALKAAITAALALGVSRLACHSDCQDLTTLLNTDGQINELEGILSDIYSLKIDFISISFHFVPRKDNSEADALAKAGLQLCNVSSIDGV